MILRIIVLLFVFVAFGFSVRAFAAENSESCRFQKRTDDFYFQSLPPEIKGFVQCGPDSETPANIIYVAQMKYSVPMELRAWFEIYQATLNPEPARISILKSQKMGSGMNAHWIESRRDGGATRHMMMTKPDGRNQLVLVQSANWEKGNNSMFSAPATLRHVIQQIDPALLDRDHSF